MQPRARSVDVDTVHLDRGYDCPRVEMTADGGSLVLRNPSSAARVLLTARDAADLLDVVD